MDPRLCRNYTQHDQACRVVGRMDLAAQSLVRRCGELVQQRGLARLDRREQAAAGKDAHPTRATVRGAAGARQRGAMLLRVVERIEQALTSGERELHAGWLQPHAQHA